MDREAPGSLTCLQVRGCSVAVNPEDQRFRVVVRGSRVDIIRRLHQAERMPEWCPVDPEQKPRSSFQASS